MYGLSLFSGIGGIELSINEEVKTVAYVENEPYCQAILIKRMQEGWINSAPIYDDVRTFSGKRYRGHVDIVFGGFPCQDISCAGTKEGIKKGNRSGLFFEFMRIVSEIRPRFVFMENTSEIIRRGLDIVLSELTNRGLTVDGLLYRVPQLELIMKDYGGISWPTPQATDYKHSLRSLRGVKNSMKHQIHWIHIVLKDHYEKTEEYGRADPHMGEWLMGFPIGWTGLEPLEMQ